MPCTFSHPAAVLPLKRLCPRHLDFAALVIGSMTPDFGYYAHQFNLASYAHTLPGCFAVCLPSGLATWLLLVFFRAPVCHLLPSPHRQAILQYCKMPFPVAPLRWLVIAACIVLGAFTHIFWDAFTHGDGWFVMHLRPLRLPWFTIGDHPFIGHYLLQQISTTVGALILLLAYRSWLARHASRENAAPGEDRWRYLLLAAIAAIALCICVPLALTESHAAAGYLAFRIFVFRAGVYFVAVFSPLILVASLVAQYRHFLVNESRRA